MTVFIIIIRNHLSYCMFVCFFMSILSFYPFKLSNHHVHSSTMYIHPFYLFILSNHLTNSSCQSIHLSGSSIRSIYSFTLSTNQSSIHPICPPYLSIYPSIHQFIQELGDLDKESNIYLSVCHAIQY